MEIAAILIVSTVALSGAVRTKRLYFFSMQRGTGFEPGARLIEDDDEKTPKHGDYGNSFTGIRFNENGGLETVTTLKYGADGEAAVANLRKGQAIRAERSRQRASALRSRVMMGSGSNPCPDGLPIRGWRD